MTSTHSQIVVASLPTNPSRETWSHAENSYGNYVHTCYSFIDTNNLWSFLPHNPSIHPAPVDLAWNPYSPNTHTTGTIKLQVNLAPCIIYDSITAFGAYNWESFWMLDDPVAWIIWRNGWLVVLKIYVALAVFQPYHDLEAGDNQSLKFKWRGGESNSGPLAPQAKSLTTRPPPLLAGGMASGFICLKRLKVYRNHDYM